MGSRDVHSRLGQRRSPSESPPSSDSEDSRRKRRRRVSSSSEDSSDNKDAETGHWKSKNKYREDEDEDMSRPWSNFDAHSKNKRMRNGYCEYHRQKGHTTNECVQLRQLIDQLVKEGRLDHLVKNIKEGKDKQRSGGKKDAPRDKADTIYM
ncbi:hypothetical protein Tco_0171064, partial [Tanacetum coccineum]